MAMKRGFVLFVGGFLSVTAALRGQDTTAVRGGGDSVSIQFVNTDLRAVIQALGRYLDKPVLVGNIQPLRVTFETPAPVPRERVPAILQGLVTSQGLQFSEDSTFYRVGLAPPAPVVARGDAGPPSSGVRLFVIRLKHARAGDVAATINTLFGGTGQFSSNAGFSTGTLSDELRRNALRTMGVGAAPAVDTTRQRGGGANLSGPVTIVPDPLTNSLLIRASADDFRVITDAVNQLDIRSLQVLIQVLIVELRRDRGFELGLDLSAKPADGGTGHVEGALQFTDGVTNLVLRVMNLHGYEVEARVRAAARRGNAKIVSRPVVVASNNREARILVGSQRPFVQVSRSLPTDAAVRDQVVQYRDVGTKLTVMPTINVDGYVSLQIRQEVNNATEETQFGAPIISTREAETTVLVRDGQTVVLGGLRENQQDISSSGIPILSSIPLVGGLFGAQRNQWSDTELYLFITPMVLPTDAAADTAAAGALDRVDRSGVKLEHGKAP
jgi:general secretion pathway protein D